MLELIESVINTMEYNSKVQVIKLQSTEVKNEKLNVYSPVKIIKCNLM